MEPLPFRPSVSPLWSFCTTSTGCVALSHSNSSNLRLSFLATEQRIDYCSQPRRPRRGRGRWRSHRSLRLDGRRRSLGRLWEGNPLEYLPYENVSLGRCQVIRDDALVYAQTKHRPGVTGRFELNNDLSNHRSPPGGCIRGSPIARPSSMLAYHEQDAGRDGRVDARDNRRVRERPHKRSRAGATSQPRPEPSEGPRPPSVKAFGPGYHSDVATLAHRGLCVLIWVNRPALRRYIGFHSRVSRCASAI